jgi:folate-binding protein YgfZ
MRADEKLRGRLDAAGAHWNADPAATDVEHYGDPAGEAVALRAGAGRFLLGRVSLVELSGPDRAEWLQGLITNDVKKLPVGRGCYAVHLSVKGRMVSDMRVFARPEALLLEVPVKTREILVTQLDRYLIREQVEIIDLLDSWTGIGIHGPKAPEVLQVLVPEVQLPEVNLAIVGGTFAGADVLIARVDETGESGYNVYMPLAAAAAFWDAIPASIRPVGRMALDMLRVAAGIPWFGDDMDDSVIPVEAGLEASAIDYQKGCYVGQEVIARLQAQGHVNRRLCQLRLEGNAVPRRGDKIRTGAREVGAITSAVLDPTTERGMALGYVRREQTNPGSTVEIHAADGGGPWSATVYPIPLQS